MKFSNHIKIKDRLIGNGKPTFFIADIAANHDGDLTRAIDLINLAAESGADAAKFQHFKAETIVSDFGFKNLNIQKSHQSKWTKTVYETYQEASLNLEWTQNLKEACDKAGIIFFTSPYDLNIVDFVDDYVPAYKIGSGDITYIEIIKKIASKNKPYILASGAASMEDVERAVRAGLEVNSQLSLLQCNTNYTGSSKNFSYINLKVLENYRKKFPNLIIGLSDHTSGHSTVLGSISLGASIIEKHFTDDTFREGPDHTFSMDPMTWKQMIDRSRELELSLGSSEKKIEDNEKETVILQRRAIRAKKDIEIGSNISKDQIIMLRPCPEDGIPPYEVENIINKKVKTKIKSGDIIRWNDIE